MRIEDIENEIMAIPLKKQVIAIAEAIGDNAGYFSLLWQLIRADKGLVSWRAAWVAENVFHARPHMLTPYLEEMIEMLSYTTNSSIKRHFYKILSICEISDEQTGPVAQLCFQTFPNPKNPPAVRAHCMQILYNIALKEPDLRQEILLLLDDCQYDLSAGIKSRALMLGKKLKKQGLKNY
jgi:hypothetical protein